MFVLGLFKMAANTTRCSKLEKWCVIKFFVIEKCKPSEISWKVFDMYREEYFDKTILIIFTNLSARAGYDTRSIFKRSLTGLNSDFSFS